MGGRGQTRPLQSGVISILVAVILLTLGAFLSLVVTLAHAYVNRAQLQAAADASALAGVADLDGSAGAFAIARISTIGLMQQHQVDRDPVAVDSASGSSNADVSVGCWDRFAAPTDAAKLAAWTDYAPGAATCGAPADVNAVQVKCGRDGSANHNSVVSNPFFGLGGLSSMKVGAGAVALGGGPCRPDRPLPLALDECQVVDPGTQILRCGQQTLVFESTGADNVCLSNLSNSAGVNLGDVEQLFTLACQNVAGTIVNGGQAIGVAGAAGLGCAMQAAFAGCLDRLVTIPIVRAGACSGPSVGTLPDTVCSTGGGLPVVRGFIQARILAVCGADSVGPPCTAAVAGVTCPVGVRAVIIDIQGPPCQSAPWQSFSDPGCSSYGGTSSDLRLVR